MSTKSIKLFLFLTILTLTTVRSQGQNIVIGIGWSETEDSLSQATKEVFERRLYQAITINKNVSKPINYNDPRFVVFPSLSIVEKRILATAPVKILLKLEVTLYLANGIRGARFNTYNTTLAGIGSTETKAYINAFRSFNATDSKLQSFLNNGKETIIRYYDDACDDIIASANSLNNLRQYESAVILLASIPEFAECYENSKPIIEKAFDKYVNDLCIVYLNKAKAIWSAGQDYDSAIEAAEYLSEIWPSSSCFKEVKKMYAEITLTIKSKYSTDKDFLFKLKEQDDRTKIEQARALGQMHFNIYESNGKTEDREEEEN
jgi:tetratricopeptide (TPR) repeat protein